MQESYACTSKQARVTYAAKGAILLLCCVAAFVALNSLESNEGQHVIRQSYKRDNDGYVVLPDAPIGTAGNEQDDGDQDADDYQYDPFHGEDTNDPADSAPDIEGQAPPTPKWHACRFQAKMGGVYDLRPLMRLARTLEEDWMHRDAIHRNTTYFLNVCANTMAVPPQCARVAKHDKSPAYQVSDNGSCYYLGTLKSFKWRPIDTENPSKGMTLFYANGERCRNGRSRQVKFTFACSEYFSYADGPMVVYETANGCHYDVHWPNRAGCPSLPLIQRLKTAADAGSTTGMSSGGTFMLVLMLALALYICGGCWYKRSSEGASGIEGCPHHTFWCSLPAMVTGLFSGGGGSRPSTRGFERVPTQPSDYGSGAAVAPASGGYGGLGSGGGGYGGVSSGGIQRDDMF